MALLASLALGLYLWNRPRQDSEEQDVLAVRPLSAAELLDAGRRALLKKGWAEAVRCFEDAVNLAPDDPAARAALEDARRQEAPPPPDRGAAAFDAYQAALRAGRWDEALASLLEATREDPERFEPFPL